jgi:hypothetical protein
MGSMTGKAALFTDNRGMLHQDSVPFQVAVQRVPFARASWNCDAWLMAEVASPP